MIERELQINKDNLDTRNLIRDSGESLSVEVRLSEIKLCLGFNIQLKLDDSWVNTKNMEKLEHYLMHEDHKISILNIEEISTKNVSKIIQLLDKPNLNINNLDVIKFGHKVLNETDFILFWKWLLNKFSLNRDNDNINIMRLLLCCSRRHNIKAINNKQHNETSDMMNQNEAVSYWI